MVALYPTHVGNKVHWAIAPKPKSTVIISSATRSLQYSAGFIVKVG
jgi:hypothetical protein